MKVTGDSTTANVDTTGLSAGNYTVTGHVSEGQKPGEFADCTANFTVKPYEPPTLSCSASPTTLKPGDTSTITATGVSPQNRPLTYSFTSSAGQVSGSGNTATLTTTGAPAGTITVTGNVSDDKGQTASCTATVTIEAPPPPPAKSQTLCNITFGRDTKRPARVDNEAKACLDQVALSAQQTPDATITVVGEAGPPPPPVKGHKAVVVENLAAQRARSTPRPIWSPRRASILPVSASAPEPRTPTKWRTTWYPLARTSTAMYPERPLSMNRRSSRKPVYRSAPSRRHTTTRKPLPHQHQPHSYQAATP